MHFSHKPFFFTWHILGGPLHLDETSRLFIGRISELSEASAWARLTPDHADGKSSTTRKPPAGELSA